LTSLAAVSSVSEFMLQPLYICICAKAEANKPKKEGEAPITSMVKGNVHILLADSSTVSFSIVL